MLFNQDTTRDILTWLTMKQNEALYWRDLSPCETIQELLTDLNREQPPIGFRGPAFDEPI